MSGRQKSQKALNDPGTVVGVTVTTLPTSGSGGALQCRQYSVINIENFSCVGGHGSISGPLNSPRHIYIINYYYHYAAGDAPT